MSKQKTLFVVISKHVMRRNILETDFWPNLIASLSDCRIVLIGEPDGEEYYKEHFAGPNVEMRFVKHTTNNLWHKIVTFMVRTGTNSHGVAMYRERSYENGETGLLLTSFKRLVSGTLGRLSMYKKFVRLLYSTLQKDWITNLYDEFKPDMVFLPSLIDIEIDGVFGVTAKRKRVKVVGMVRSWDNLSIHGLMPYIPDHFILQNQWLKESAEMFQALDMAKVSHDIIGLPHYDKYLDPSDLIFDKDELFTKLGLDPQKRTIYFTGFDIYFSEAIVPRLLNDAIENGQLPKDLQVLFTRHPASKVSLEEYQLDELEHVVYVDMFDNTALKFQGTEQTFINFVSHADVVVNVASTVAIDCAVLNKPVICISFDNPELKLKHWSQAERLFDSFDHYERLIGTGGAFKASSPDLLLDQINKYLENPNLDYEKRQVVKQLFVEPFDGKSGSRLVKIVADELNE